MTKVGNSAAHLGVLISALLLTASGARAEVSYKDRTVTLYVGFSPGAGYDIYARLVARHMGRHLNGNPSIVVKNMEGAGGLVLANWLYAIAPRDGTAFATFSRVTPFNPILGLPGAQFKDEKAFTYVGSANDEISVCVAWRGSGVETFKDLQTKELITGGFGAETESEQHVKVLNGVLGTKMKLVNGYRGGSDVTLAMQRGEVQARCGWSWTGIKSVFPDWRESKQFSVVVQNSLSKHPDLPEVPSIMDQVQTEQQRDMLKFVFAPQKMGRPYMAPPNLSAEHLAALQQAFSATMKDTEFLADAEKGKLEISPISGAEMQDLVEAIYHMPADVVKTSAAMMR
jgi:tripartite-type tricarboxylate transporter receptor subunit TctC